MIKIHDGSIPAYPRSLLISNKPYRLGAQALIFDQDDHVLLIQHQSYNDDEWNFPGGGRDKGETAIDNALREATEELGLDQSMLQPIGVSTHPNQYDFPQRLIDEGTPLTRTYRGQHKDHVYIRFLGDKAAIQADSAEVRHHKWVPLNQLSSYLVFPNQYHDLIPVIDEYLALK